MYVTINQIKIDKYVWFRNNFSSFQTARVGKTVSEGAVLSIGKLDQRSFLARIAGQLSFNLAS